MTESRTSPPERLGPYRIERRLGRGGMGEVFLAWDERLRRAVALKRIRGDAPLAPAPRERLRREARSVARLDHPGIVRVHDVVEGDGEDWIVLEHVEGRSLAELAAGDGLPVSDALDLARQVAEALAHAHERGILHRDLKAENVRVTPEGRAKVLDLGLAKPIGPASEDGSLTGEGALVGTPRVMAPEQIAGGPVDARADLFSLGVLLYELLTARTPFGAPSRAATLRRILSDVPPPVRSLRPELPQELSDLVEELLATEPDDRPAGASEVAGRLAAIAGHREVAALASPGPLRAPESWTGEPTCSSPGRPAAGPLSPAAIGALAARRRGGRRVTWGLGLLVVVVAVAALLVPVLRPDPPRLVAVVEPEVTDGGEGGGAAVAAAVHAALLDGLASLRGVVPVEPSELAAAPAEPLAAARATAADEMLRAVLTCGPGECEVVLRRIGSDGERVLAAGRPFTVPARAERRLALADTVELHLQRQLYPDQEVLEGTAELDVRDPDYGVYLDVLRRLDEGDLPSPDDLGRLEGVVAGSPRFLEGWILAARIARTLDRLDRAAAFAAAAGELVPEDPRPWAERFDIAVARDRLDEAESILGTLERLAPGEPRTERARVRLWIARDRLPEAIAAARELVARRRSWRNLWDLANAQMLGNEPLAAEETLEELLEVSPGNRWGLTKRAELEIFCDRLERARESYRDLLEIAPAANVLRNMAWIDFLLARYDEAVEAGRRALALEPGHLRARLNLALAEDARGGTEEAARLYRELAEEAWAGEGDATREVIRAQALVRLGRHLDAVRVLREVLVRRAALDRQDHYMAAQVFALAGERLSALDAVERALAGGVGARWFEMPAFDSLAGDPELAALLARYRERCS